MAEGFNELTAPENINEVNIYYIHTVNILIG